MFVFSLIGLPMRGIPCFHTSVPENTHIYAQNKREGGNHGCRRNIWGNRGIYLSGRLASFLPPHLLVVTLSHCLHSSTFAAPSLSLFLCSQPLSFALLGNFPPSVSQTHHSPTPTSPLCRAVSLSPAKVCCWAINHFSTDLLFFIRKMLSDRVSRSMPVGNDPPLSH